MNELEWFERWYQSQCNGDWEHKYGAEIRSLDNPGWLLTVDLRGTTSEERSLDKVEVERSDTDWLHYWVEKKRFQAACSPLNLREVLRKFREFMDAAPKTSPPPVV